MLKNLTLTQLTKSLLAQYYNIAQQYLFCTYVRMHVGMYAFVSFLMIKSGVFVSATCTSGFVL